VDELCGKVGFSTVDNPAFLLRTNRPVGKSYFNPQVKRRYPEPSCPFKHRVLNSPKHYEYWAALIYPQRHGVLRINIKTKLF
jgi:hypothetical protein